MTDANAESPNVMPESTITAREIAKGTGLSLSAVYRALRRMEERGVLIRVPGTAGGRPRKGGLK